VIVAALIGMIFLKERSASGGSRPPS